MENIIYILIIQFVLMLNPVFSEFDNDEKLTKIKEDIVIKLIESTISLSRSYADIRYENILKDNFFSEYRINNFDIYDQLGVKRLNIDEIIIDVSDTQNANEFRIDLLLSNLNFNMNESFFYH